ncbi:MAG: hypothetical protein AVDCRST_MAG80-1146, partial [uncultured Rubrobacteraceae bacterium]
VVQRRLAGRGEADGAVHQQQVD